MNGIERTETTNKNGKVTITTDKIYRQERRLVGGDREEQTSDDTSFRPVDFN